MAMPAPIYDIRTFREENISERPPVASAKDVYRILGPRLSHLDHEECWVLYLNRANYIVGKERLTSGTVDMTLIDVKRVLRGVFQRQAKAVILVHNHPSGSPLPGEADIRETRRLQLALKTFDCALFDHIVIADGSYYSFQDERVVKTRL